MGRFSRWLSRRFKTRCRATLAVERLEARTTPATSAGPGGELIGVSGDGNFILFASDATDLVAGATDGNSVTDLFWRDTKAGVTKLVTAQAGTLNAVGFGSGGTGLPVGTRAVLSHDGQRVAFVSAVQAAVVTGDVATLDQSGTNDVFWWRADTGQTKLASARSGLNAAVGNTAGAGAVDPSLSDDGRFVGYGTTLDAALIDGSSIDGASTYDLFRRHMTATGSTGTTVAASGIPAGGAVVGKYGDVARPVGPYLSGDGRYVVFATEVEADTVGTVPDLAETSDVFLRDLNGTTAGSIALVSVASDGTALGNTAGQWAALPVLARGGSAVAFAAAAHGGADGRELVDGYTNQGAPADLYARLNPFDAKAARTALVSGVIGSSSVGANGFVALPAAGSPAEFRVSADGRFVAFASAATNLVDAGLDKNGGLDVFLRDTSAGTTELVSVGRDGRTGGTPSERPTLSDDGRYVAFVSTAPDLGQLVADGNNAADAFLRDRTDKVTRVVGTAPGRATGNGATVDAAVSADGGRVAFVSQATDLAGTTVEEAGDAVYTTGLPLDRPFGGAGNVVAVTGPVGGLTWNYVFDPAGKLVPAGDPFVPFPGAAGTARTAAGDVNGDGVTDFVYAAGAGGGSLLRVVNGATGADLAPVQSAFETSFKGGLFVAAGDIDADGKAEVVVSPDRGGGGRVQVYSFDGGVLVQKASFFGIDDAKFRGGARVAVGDTDGDGGADVIVGAGFGGGPRVAVFDGKTAFDPAGPTRLMSDFFAFPGADATRLRNGVFVAAGDLTGDGKADFIFGGGPGGGPRVFALDGNAVRTDLTAAYDAPVANFFAFDAKQRGGVRVTTKDIDGDGRADLVVGSGERAGSLIKTYLGKNLVPGGQSEPTANELFDPFAGKNLEAGLFVG